jgi:adenylosuccinate lyase
LIRDDAYRIAQEHAQRAWDTRTPLRELLNSEVASDPSGPVAQLDLDAIFDLGHYSRHAEAIVGRLW